MAELSTLLSSNGTMNREQLMLVPTPPGTPTHKLIPHYKTVTALEDTLGLYKIGITREQHAVSKDGMKHYATYDLTTGFPGGNFTIGSRNSHDKSLSFSLVAGYRVVVCDNGKFDGNYISVMKKHTKNFDLEDALNTGIGRIIKNFDGMAKDIQRWKATQITDVTAKLSIYEAFLEYEANLPRHLMRATHDHYFNPQYEDFRERTLWSLENAFTSAINTLDPIPQHKAAANIGEYFQHIQQEYLNQPLLTRTLIEG